MMVSTPYHENITVIKQYLYNIYEYDYKILLNKKVSKYLVLLNTF